MPGPYPGMDPYLEHPARWPSVHHRLITYLGDLLTSILPSGYDADIGERLYVVQPSRDIYPDVALRETGRRSKELAVAAVGQTPADPHWDVPVESDEIREGYIEIVKAGEPGRVVTIIEILSPRNKAAGSEGRRLYREKQREVLASPIHLLEIDLLRRGEHTVAAPLDRLITMGVWDYLVSISRGDQRDHCQIWATTLRNHLPKVPIPLAPDTADIIIDLQEILGQVYDRGGYGSKLNYQVEPVPALSPADAAWSDALLRERKLRS